MDNFTPISATLGGVLIGLSAVWLMASAGRIAGISGILGGLFGDFVSRNSSVGTGERGWRMSFLLGLILAPFLVGFVRPEMLDVNFPTTGPWLILAAVCVGIGTQLGNGCTSGHGVCGNARLSMRSITATLTFMATGIATVFALRYFGGL